MTVTLATIRKKKTRRNNLTWASENVQTWNVDGNITNKKETEQEMNDQVWPSKSKPAIHNVNLAKQAR